MDIRSSFVRSRQERESDMCEVMDTRGTVKHDRNRKAVYDGVVCNDFPRVRKQVNM